MAHFRSAETGPSSLFAWIIIFPALTDGPDVGTEAVSDPRTGRIHGLVREVRIATGCLNLRVGSFFNAD